MKVILSEDHFMSFYVVESTSILISPEQSEEISSGFLKVLTAPAVTPIRQSGILFNSAAEFLLHVAMHLRFIEITLASAYSSHFVALATSDSLVSSS